jgi:uncharacterized membrane protein
MKFLKAFFVVVLLLVAGLLLVGVFVPEIDDEIELQVNAPIITVFAGMMNTADLPNWVDDLESVEQTGGLLAMPGSTFKLHFKSKEMEEVYNMEILEMKPMKSVRFRLYNDKMDIEMSMGFEADALATDLHVFVQIKGDDLLTRAMLPLMKGVIMEALAQDFENFKQLQES